MRVGLFAPLGNPFADPDYLRALGPAAEDRGFHSLWVGEHVVLFDEYGSRYPYAVDGRIPLGGTHGLLEPFTALSFLAAGTFRIRLGTGICLVPQRNPVYTAKQAADLDWVSGGRLDLGVGVGWLREEFEALGVPFARRGARCRDYLEAMKRLWCDEVSSHEGEFYTLPPCRQYPKPVQLPHPPIHFGGESEAALRRVADLGQGWLGFDLDVEGARQGVKRLRELVAERGRDPSGVQASVCPYFREVTPEDFAGYREAGVDQLVLTAVGGDRDTLLRRLDALARDFVSRAERL